MTDPAVAASDSPARRSIPAGLADLAAVVLFVIVGRASHDSGGGIVGFVSTLWPFIAAQLIGVTIVRTRRWDHAALWPAGVVICAATVVGGLAIRAAVAGEPPALAFVVVGTVTLAAAMLGWRLVLLLVRGRGTKG